MKILTMALAATITVTFFAIPAQAKSRKYYKPVQHRVIRDVTPAFAAFQIPRKALHRLPYPP